VEIIKVTLEFLHIFYFYYKKLIIFKTEESILLHVARKKSIKETKPSLNRSKAINFFEVMLPELSPDVHSPGWQPLVR